MLKTGLAAFLLLAGANSYPQMLLDTMYFNRSWKQTTRDSAYYYRQVFAGMGKKVQFIVKDYYLSGKLQMEGAYKSIHPDMKEGHFVYYYENGRKMTEADYAGNEVEGIYREWFPSGNPKLYSEIREGDLDGPYRTWGENGVKQLDIGYRQGALDGKFISYYENGAPVRKDAYSKGELVKKQCFTKAEKDTTWFPYLQMPQFPGGEEKLNEYIDHQLVYPGEAKEKETEGIVMVEFSIDKDGNISKVNITKGDREYFNREAIRLVKSFPRWSPGRKDGRLVDVTLSLPIHFRISKEQL